MAIFNSNKLRDGEREREMYIYIYIYIYLFIYMYLLIMICVYIYIHTVYIKNGNMHNMRSDFLACFVWYFLSGKRTERRGKPLRKL